MAAMTAHRIWIERSGQLDDEIWADSRRCQDAIADLIGPGAPGTAVSYGAVPGGAETSADTWCGACGGFMWHGADCACPDKTTDRKPLENPPYAARCPECGEAAVRQPPADLVPWEAHGMERPEWSHADRSALCPVIGPSGGYQPAQPRRAEPGPEPGPDITRLDPPPTMPTRWSVLGAEHEAEPG
jgi:hypothetical protein